jgi:hypothetical protein
MARDGWLLIMTVNGFMKAIGRGAVAEWSTIIAGTGAGNAISIMTGTTGGIVTITTTIAAKRF